MEGSIVKVLLVRPKIDLETAKKVVFDLYGLNVTKILELNGYDDKNFHVFVDQQVNNNACIEQVSLGGYVLKIVNTLDSQDVQGFEAQTELLIYLNDNNIRCPKIIQTKEQKHFDVICLTSGKHVARLLEFIPGDILFNLANPNREVFYQVGVLAAKMDNVLQNFDHPAYHKKVQWCLGATPDILNYIHAVEEKKQILVKDTVSEFSSRVLTIEAGLSKGVIHGDINEQNLIVGSEQNETVVKAVIDFGDTHYCCYLYELALAMTYMIFLSGDVDSGGYVVAGYSSVREVKDEEFNLLKICVMARFCQSLVLGAYASTQEPDNQYILTTAKTGWGILEKLYSESEIDVLSRWRSIIVQQKSTKNELKKPPLLN